MTSGWVYAVIVFLFALSIHKYNDLTSLYESVNKYIDSVRPIINEEKEEEDKSNLNLEIDADEIILLSDIKHMMIQYAIRNPELFSNINNKDE